MNYICFVQAAIIMVAFNIHFAVNLRHEWLRSLKFKYALGGSIEDVVVSIIGWIFLIAPIVLLVLSVVNK